MKKSEFLTNKHIDLIEYAKHLILLKWAITRWGRVTLDHPSEWANEDVVDNFDDAVTVYWWVHNLPDHYVNKQYECINLTGGLSTKYM